MRGTDTLAFKEVFSFNATSFGKTYTAAGSIFYILMIAIVCGDFDKKAVFIDPKVRRSGETDAKIDTFCDSLIDIGSFG